MTAHTEERQDSALPDLSKEDVARYSRHLLMPEIGVRGQRALKKSRVLIVGAGGLGSPAALYLSAAGIGHVGVVDYDRVDFSNLHRQVIHTEDRVGQGKAQSAVHAMQALNSSCSYAVHDTMLDGSTAMEMIRDYDIVLDCTDNVPTRYLINDACCLLGRPLVSASAIRLEGQLTVYHFRGGPCYRCLFPRPPPVGTVTNCGDGGVLGCVPGFLGCLQAMEAIKVAMLLHLKEEDAASSCLSSLSERMLIFNGRDSSFRVVRLRPAQPDCVSCGPNRTMDRLLDSYEEFAGTPACDKTLQKTLLPDGRRISCRLFHEAYLSSSKAFILIDVRPTIQFDICSLDGSVNIPLEMLSQQVSRVRNLIARKRQKSSETIEVYFICRRGNRSQDAVCLMDAAGPWEAGVTFRDIAGGLTGWSREVDPEFPIY